MIGDLLTALSLAILPDARAIAEEVIEYGNERSVLAPTGGSRQRSRTSAMQGEPDGRRMRPGPLLTRTDFQIRLRLRKKIALRHFHSGQPPKAAG
jgi:hypothetical protein